MFEGRACDEGQNRPVGRYLRWAVGRGKREERKKEDGWKAAVVDHACAQKRA